MAQTHERRRSIGCCLSGGEFSVLADYAARAAWPSGFQIYERGATADGVFVVLSGVVMLRSKVRIGRSFVPAVAFSGGTFGAEGLCPNGAYATEARTGGETETLFLNSSRLRAFVRERPADALTLFSQVMAERAALLEKMCEITTLSLEQRIVSTLHRMVLQKSVLEHDDRFEISGVQYRLLCELVGATRESVALVLGRLCENGTINREGSTMFVASSSRLLDRSGYTADHASRGDGDPESLARATVCP